MYPLSTQKLLNHLPAMAGMVRRAALAAGDAIMGHYDPSGFHGVVELKKDDSPVTIADLTADRIIREFLTENFPGIPMITEETVDQIDRIELGKTDHYWLVDPLDGTKSFRRGERDFTVNIALIYNDMPVLGVIYAPAHGEGYIGVWSNQDRMAFRWRDDVHDDYIMQTRLVPPQGLTLLTSQTQSHSVFTANFMDRIKINKHLKRSSSIKYTEVACARADVVISTRPIYFWDTAAGDAIIRASGGHVVDLQGQPIRYDRTHPQLTNTGLIACGDFDYVRAVLNDLTL